MSAEELEAKAKRIGPQQVLSLASQYGVPQDESPAVALIEIRPGLATGWLVDLHHTAPYEAPTPEPWPRGELFAVGTITMEQPTERARPLIWFNEGGIALYFAELTIPSGIATARAEWPPMGKMRCGIEPDPDWTQRDEGHANAALNWLVNLANEPGRRRVEDTTAAEKAIAFKRAHPNYTWAQVAKRYYISPATLKRHRKIIERS